MLLTFNFILLLLFFWLYLDVDRSVVCSMLMLASVAHCCPCMERRTSKMHLNFTSFGFFLDFLLHRNQFTDRYRLQRKFKVFKSH